jgi:hypothetical protein
MMRKWSIADKSDVCTIGHCCINNDVLRVVDALEHDVMQGQRLRWKVSKTRNVEEMETHIRGCRVVLEREVWLLPEFALASHNIRIQDGANRQTDYVLGFMHADLNHRLAKLWRAVEAMIADSRSHNSAS